MKLVASSKTRKLLNNSLTEWLDKSITIISVILWLIVMHYAFTQTMPRARYGVLFLGIILTIYIMSELKIEIEKYPKRKGHLLLLVLSTAITISTIGYLFIHFYELFNVRVGYAISYEIYMSIIFTMSIIYLTWRAFGMTFLWIIVVGILYGYFGYMAPGVLGHAGLSLDRLAMVLVLDIEGFFGFLNQIMAAWVALFLLFAGLLQAYGAFDLIFRIAAKAAKYIDSGIAQTAVVSSAVIGSVNGSQTANAGMTGSFTIPLMKKNGIRKETAAGIEAVASTSGQVLPPVMGAGAFIMASLLGISYATVIIAGIVPAAILALVIAFGVHFMSVDQLNSTGMDDLFDEKLKKRQKVIQGLRFGIPLAILIWALGIAQYTVMTSALYTTLSMLVTGIMFPVIGTTYNVTLGNGPFYSYENVESIDNKRYEKNTKSNNVITRTNNTRIFIEIKEQVSNTIWGFRKGAMVAAPVAIILAAINGVVDILVTTGVPAVVTLALMSLSGGMMLLAAILAMIICILLGLGMPTTGAYTVVALLVAPTLISDFLIPDLAAHFFVFYAAILAGLTPPIATCSAVAAGVANAGFWRTCYESIKLSAPLFILPFSFIYHPHIVDGSIDAQTFLTGTIILAGSLGMVYGLNYSFPYHRLKTMGIRTAYIITGMVVIMFHDTIGQLIGVMILSIIFTLQKFVLNGSKSERSTSHKTPSDESA